MRKIFSLIVVFIFCVSCTGKIASFEFESYHWQKNTPVDFSFEVKENKTKNLILEIRSVYGFPYKSLSLDFVLTNSDGEKYIVSKDVLFNEENLDCSGDFCDQKIQLFNKIHLKKGSYKLQTSHYNMDQEIYGLIEFRLLEE